MSSVKKKKGFYFFTGCCEDERGNFWKNVEKLVIIQVIGGIIGQNILK